MYSLPQPVQPLPDESLPGFVMRNAETYHFSQPERLLRLLKLGKMPLSMICQQDPSLPVGQAIGHLLGLDGAQLRRLSLWHASKTTVNVLGFDVHHELVRHRRRSVCPACLVESQHHRAVWLMDIMPVCAIHGSWIIQSCPRCRKPLTWQGTGPHRCRCGFDLRQAELKLDTRRAGTGIRGLNSVFNSLTAAPVDLDFGRLLEVALRLGLYLQGLEDQINHGQRVAGFVRTQRALLPSLLASGWGMLAGWPDSFQDGLREIRSGRSSKSVAGIEQSFRGLHAWLFRWKRLGWGEPLAQEFARHVAASADVASNRHALSAYGSRAATRRADMSMREAQEALKVSAQTMQRIIGRNPSMVMREASTGVPSLLKGEEIRRLKRLDSTLLTIKGVQTLLGVGRPVFLNLEKMGLVHTVTETEYLLENRAYRKSEVQALLDRCVGNAEPLEPDEVAVRGLVTLEGAGRRWRTIYDVIEAISSRRLRPVGIDACKRGLRSILLDPTEVEAVLPHRDALCVSSDLCETLGVKQATLRTWRRAGFIHAYEQELIARHEGVFYSPDAIHAFQREFVTSVDLTRSSGRTSTGPAFARDLKAIGVNPISGPGVDDVCTFLYRRSDVTPEAISRADAVRSKPDLAVQRDNGRRRVDLALGIVASRWAERSTRKRNTLTFAEMDRVVHAIAGTRVGLAGRFTFHLDPVTYQRLSGKGDAWIAFIPSEGENFILAPFGAIRWPPHVGGAEGKTKWLSMWLRPVVEERWKAYSLPLHPGGEDRVSTQRSHRDWGGK